MSDARSSSLRSQPSSRVGPSPLLRGISAVYLDGIPIIRTHGTFDEAVVPAFGDARVDGLPIGDVAVAGFYTGTSCAPPTPTSAVTDASSYNKFASAEMNTTMIEGPIIDNLRLGILNGAATLAANPLLADMFPELMMNAAGSSESGSSESMLNKNTLIDELVAKEWGDDFEKLREAVLNIRDHVEIPDRTVTGDADLMMKSMGNKVLGFLCTCIEPLPKTDVQRIYGCAGQKAQCEGRHYAFHGIIVRPSDVQEEDEDEENPKAGNVSNRSMTAQQKAASLSQVPTRKQIDALVEYFLLLQNWAQVAIQSEYGRLTRKRAIRGLMVLFQPEPKLHSSWLRGVIDGVEIINSSCLITVTSIDTGDIFRKIPCKQATWLVPDWLETLPPLSVRAMFPDSFDCLHDRKMIAKDGEQYTTRMYMNVADENVMDPAQQPERLFHRQLFDQCAVWYCLLRRQQCLRMNTIHLRFYGATFYPPTKESREKKLEITDDSSGERKEWDHPKVAPVTVKHANVANGKDIEWLDDNITPAN